MRLTNSSRWLAVLSLVMSAGVAAGGREASIVDAVRDGNTAAVRMLLKDRADRAGVNTPEPDGTTALHWAVQRNNLEIADLLIRAGAGASATNRYGISPLHLACVNGNAAMIERLVAAGADVNKALPQGETPLMTAARTGTVEAIRVLLAHGARVNAVEQWKGQTALMWAASENNAAAARVLFEAGADLYAHTKSGDFTAYLFAVRGGHLATVRVLLDAGADVNETLRDGTSALVLSVMNGHYELAGLLLDYGADATADRQGWAALHQVVWTRRPNSGSNLPGAVPTGTVDSIELVRKLLRYGADINARLTKEPKDGFRNMLRRIGATPFLLAAKSDDLPLMRLLLEKGADPKLNTEDGTTPLMAAAGVGIWAPGENPGTEVEALAAVKLALEAGGGAVTDVDKQGETALHGAIYRAGSISVAKFLIDRGAKLDARNQKGWTPLAAADGVEYTPNVLKRYPETAAFLRQVMRERGMPVPEQK